MKKSYLSKQLIAVIVIAVVLAIAIPLYFFVLAPYFRRANEGTASEAEPYIEGETLSGTSLRMMTVEEDADKQVYTLGKGDEYSWSFYVSGSNIYIQDYELTPYDGNHMVFLHSSLAAPMVTRILPTSEELKAIRHEKAEKMSDKELEEVGGEDHIAVTNDDLASYELPAADYGFEDLPSLNYYTATDKNGVTHKVYIGAVTPDGGNIYAMYEGRKAVYMISSTIADYFTVKVTDVASPLLTTVPEDASTGNYTPDEFIIYRGKEPYVRIHRYSSEEALALDRVTNSLLVKHIYDDENGEPVYNLYDTSSEYSSLLYNKFRSSISGSEVVEMAKCEAVIENAKKTYRPGKLSDETLAAYGISKDEPYRSFYYVKGDLVNLLVFSPPENDGDGRFYYVYNPQYEFIVKVYASDVDFMEKDETFYLSNYVSMIVIDNLNKLTVDSAGLKDQYFSEQMNLIRVKESFTLNFVMNAAGTEKVLGESGGAQIKSVTTSDGKDLPDAGDVSGVNNFKALYARLLNIKMYTNVEEQMEEIEKVDLSTPDVCVTYEVYSGKTHKLNFYFFGASGNLCFYTYDEGKERYVVESRDVAKLLRAVELVQKGESVEKVLGSIA